MDSPTPPVPGPARARGLGRQAWAWALYDWANSAFATTVMAGFFPVFFKEYWNAGVPATESTLRLAVANSLSGVLVAVLAPVLGAIADRGGYRRRFLFGFAGLGILATAALYGVGRGAWAWAALLFVLGTVGFAAGNVFYDALLVGVADDRRLDVVSALGYSLGYLGGGLLFAGNVVLTLNPGWFGLPDAGAAVRLSFLTVSVWWALFTVPLWRWVGEPPATGRGAAGWRAVADGLRQLGGTLRRARSLRTPFLFLIAYWLYIDGVDTIIRMAVDYGLSIGLASSSLITALLVTQFVGFPAALGFGYVGKYLGPKRGIQIALCVYLGVTVWGAFMDSVAEFYGLAVAVGLVQGGVQSLSRSLYARLIPPGSSAEFFGFFNMMGKFAVVLGPVLMGWTAVLSGSSRASILAVAVLILAGMAVLAFVDEHSGGPPANSPR